MSALPDSIGWWRIKISEGHAIRKVPGIDDGWGEPIRVGQRSDGVLIIEDAGAYVGLHGVQVDDADVVWGPKCEVSQDATNLSLVKQLLRSEVRLDQARRSLVDAKAAYDAQVSVMLEFVRVAPWAFDDDHRVQIDPVAAEAKRSEGRT